MTDFNPKAELRRFLQDGRDALVWKLDGLGEYDIRRPVTPTGTNLLGLVKHLSNVEFGYFGDTFGRPSSEPKPWSQEDPVSDMWARADESRDQIISLYKRAWAHADSTIETLPLDATGQVPWWPSGRNQVTLHKVMVLVIEETSRHAGHADIVREFIDGSAGLSPGNDNLPSGDAAWWENYRHQLEQAAQEASRYSSNRAT